MSEDPNQIEDLPDSFLVELYEAEARAELPAGCEDRVLAGVLESLSQGLLVKGVAPGLTTGKMLTVALVSAVLGGFAGAAIEHNRSKTVSEEPVQQKDTEAPTTVKPIILSIDAGTAVPLSDAQPAPKRSTTRKVWRRPESLDASMPTIDPIPREAYLINRARTALRRGLLDDALLALMQHERIFQKGRLAEERDVLVIETYAAQGRLEIAMRRIRRYRTNYPTGLHRKRIDRIEMELSSKNQ